MTYLFAAYVAIWCILFVYIFTISSRQRSLERTLHGLQESFGSGKKP
jgi:CcmD family protein